MSTSDFSLATFSPRFAIHISGKRESRDRGPISKKTPNAPCRSRANSPFVLDSRPVEPSKWEKGIRVRLTSYDVSKGRLRAIFEKRVNGLILETFRAITKKITMRSPVSAPLR